MPKDKNEASPALGREPFNILTVLVSGFSVKRQAGVWRVMLLAARPSGSADVTDATMDGLIASGLVTIGAELAAITPNGRRAVNDALREASADALTWSMSFAGMEKR